MTVYYTTSTKPNDVQTKPYLSLGRFISSTSPRNDDFENLFSNISQLAIRNNRDEYIALMLKNETGATATNVRIWSEAPVDSYSVYKMAGVIPAQNANGDWVMEKTLDKFARPYNAEFEDATLAAPLLLGNIPDEGVIAVWIKRSLLKTFIKEDQKLVYEPDPQDPRRYIPIEKGKEDIIPIKISWS